MRIKTIMMLTAAVMLFSWLLSAGSGCACAQISKTRYLVVTSDTILSGMAEALLPETQYRVEAILPPGQCPGHYDVKLSDIEKIKKADLMIAFRGMPFLNQTDLSGRTQLFVDMDGRYWMAPDSYIYGLNRMADALSIRFPKNRDDISRRKAAVVGQVKKEANSLKNQTQRAGFAGKPIIASALQKEPLEWMGFHVVGVYGRPEAMSTKDVIRLLKIGREERVVAVVDNLQSGPETGKGIAETLGRPHIVLNNFPSERGYLETLRENVQSVLTAMVRK